MSQSLSAFTTGNWGGGQGVGSSTHKGGSVDNVLAVTLASTQKDLTDTVLKVQSDVWTLHHYAAAFEKRQVS